MPEVFLCSECGERVDLTKEEYVVPNRPEARSKSQWVYAHATCLEGGKALAARISQMSDVELQQAHRALQARDIARLSDETLELLGLQRITRKPA